MKFFILKHSTDFKTVGPFPQLEKMFDGFNMQRPYEAWGGYEYITPPMRHLNGFKLKRQSKVTDLVSAAQFGVDSMLISQRFFSLLQQHSCMDTMPVDSEVLQNDKSYPYKFVYFPKVQNHFVDFNRSRFYLNSSTGWSGDIKFDNFEQYEKTRQDLDKKNIEARSQGEYHKERNIRALELFIDEAKANLDFFRIDRMMIAFVVSERLKSSIESQGLTGMQFIPAQGHVMPTMYASVNPPREIT